MSTRRRPGGRFGIAANRNDDPDSRDSAESLAMLLELEGHEARVAHDGQAALAEAERWRPDVVLLDLGMPRMNGYEACRRIREQPWGRTMVLIALTGWGGEGDRRQTREAGFDEHLIKPVDADNLHRRLADLPRARRAPREVV